MSRFLCFTTQFENVSNLKLLQYSQSIFKYQYQILEMEENCQVLMWDKVISYPLSPRKKRKEKEELQSSSPTILVTTNPRGVGGSSCESNMVVVRRKRSVGEIDYIQLHRFIICVVVRYASEETENLPFSVQS